MAIGGPGIEPGRLPDGTGLDLAPTLLDLMGVAKPNHFDGTSILAERAGMAQRAAV